MIRILTAACVLMVAIFPAGAHAADGLIVKQSAYSFEETLSRLEAALGERNITVMNKIDHAAGAAKAEVPLRPTTLVIFGNPAIGSQLMAASQSIGIDLPLKALVFEDENGAVFVEYNNMQHLAKRHGIAADHPVIGRITGGLEMVSNAATAPAQ